ncbi:MAG: ferredoxin--NADP(+) reductase [Gammaproteobacteria bacterium]|jgi:thioredoxin reductase (NADPH)|nr:ferredoxin--NADP(+) reductase [Gammaproteobacteria bacterium]
MKETDILIIGAGPVGLFTVFEAGLLGLECELVDNLDKIGGQCIELYPDKPIYDIPGVANQTGREHIEALLAQIKPFNYKVNLNTRVESIKKEKDNWIVKTNNDLSFLTKNIFIAAGAGSFESRRPPVENPDKFLGNGIEYAVRDIKKYKDKEITIFGGGDSALDWSVELAKTAKKVYLVHRRDEFRGAKHTESQMRELVKSGKIELKIPYVIKSINGDEKFNGVDLMHFESKEVESINCDEALFFFGLNKQLGPILDWEVELEEKKISVNTENFQTNKEGIFAVGDINTYPGKLDLILCGFHETTLAVQEAFKRIHPGERVPFGYTTSNKGLQEKLKVNKS